MYPKAFIDYLIHFHCDRDYFECHEILEEYWKEDPTTERKPHWVGLIQIAVSLYHQRRGNISGALRMMKSAITICEEHKYALSRIGIQDEKLIEVLQGKYQDIKSGVSYVDINLPIVDDLLAICQSLASDKGKQWGAKSDLSDKELIHKHKLRDRSDVIAERQKQILLKQKSRKK
ncbi:DUF309 domain-containing protein [Ferdinandcohnia sp. Marseille-Q9671]